MSLVSGGITNALFKLSADGVKPVLGRVYGMFTEKLIDREVEVRRMGALWKCGFGAQVRRVRWVSLGVRSDLMV